MYQTSTLIVYYDTNNLDNKQHFYLKEKGDNFIGYLNPLECNINLYNQKNVEKKHCKIEIKRQQCFIQDLSKTKENGVWIINNNNNQKEQIQKSKEIILNNENNFTFFINQNIMCVVQQKGQQKIELQLQQQSALNNQILQQQPQNIEQIQEQENKIQINQKIEDDKQPKKRGRAKSNNSKQPQVTKIENIDPPETPKDKKISFKHILTPDQIQYLQEESQLEKEKKEEEKLNEEKKEEEPQNLPLKQEISDEKEDDIENSEQIDNKEQIQLDQQENSIEKEIQQEQILKSKENNKKQVKNNRQSRSKTPKNQQQSIKQEDQIRQTRQSTIQKNENITSNIKSSVNNNEKLSEISSQDFKIRTVDLNDNRHFINQESQSNNMLKYRKNFQKKSSAQKFNVNLQVVEKPIIAKTYSQLFSDDIDSEDSYSEFEQNNKQNNKHKNKEIQNNENKDKQIQDNQEDKKEFQMNIQQNLINNEQENINIDSKSKNFKFFGNLRKKIGLTVQQTENTDNNLGEQNLQNEEKIIKKEENITQIQTEFEDSNKENLNPESSISNQKDSKQKQIQCGNKRKSSIKSMNTSKQLKFL